MGRYEGLPVVGMLVGATEGLDVVGTSVGANVVGMLVGATEGLAVVGSCHHSGAKSRMCRIRVVVFLRTRLKRSRMMIAHAD